MKRPRRFIHQTFTGSWNYFQSRQHTEVSHMQMFNKDNFTPVNEVFARGTVLSIKQSPFGPTVLCVIAKVRRDKAPLILNFTMDVQAGTRSGGPAPW